MSERAVVALDYGETTPLRVAEAMVLRVATREPKALPTWQRARDMAAKLGPLHAFDAKLIAAGQVSAAVRVRAALHGREKLGGMSVTESRAHEALDAWITDFEGSAR